MNCDYCGSPAHVWWDCPKKPAGWKPGRVRLPAFDADAAVAAGVERVAKMTPAEVAVAHKAAKAKIRAAKKPAKAGSQRGGSSATKSTAAPVHQTANGVPKAAKSVAGAPVPAKAPPSTRGRPRLHPDRKAYKAQKERERRAKLKEKP